MRFQVLRDGSRQSVVQIVHTQAQSVRKSLIAASGLDAVGRVRLAEPGSPESAPARDPFRHLDKAAAGAIVKALSPEATVTGDRG